MEIISAGIYKKKEKRWEHFKNVNYGQKFPSVPQPRVGFHID
jgi:hypothetical protein